MKYEVVKTKTCEKGSSYHTAPLPIGSKEYIGSKDSTVDINAAFRTLAHRAEQLKIFYGDKCFCEYEVKEIKE